MIATRTRTREQRRRSTSRGGAFTLIELLVVIAILAALSLISLPAIRGIGASNVVTSGTQQLVDDLMLARHKAMVNRTTVHVVFVPPDIIEQNPPGSLSTRDEKVWNRVRGGAYTMYALYAERTLGDQPGKRNERYLTDWRTLPEGIFIADYEYGPPDVTDDPFDRPFNRRFFRFPSEQSSEQRSLPHIAFDQNG